MDQIYLELICNYAGDIIWQTAVWFYHLS